MATSPPIDILLVEPENLLRRTVSLTVRSLGTARVTEAAAYSTAHELCAQRPFDGAVIAIDWPSQQVVCDGLALVHRIRAGDFPGEATMPIAILVSACDTGLLHELRARDIHRVLIKPFRARDVIDTIAGMRRLVTAAGAPADAP